MCITGRVVLGVGSVVVVAAVVVAVGALVLVTCRTVVVGTDAAPDVLTVLVRVALGEPDAAEVVGPPSVAPPVPPGNDGPEELAAAFEWE